MAFFHTNKQGDFERAPRERSSSSRERSFEKAGTREGYRTTETSTSCSKVEKTAAREKPTQDKVSCKAEAPTQKCETTESRPGLVEDSVKACLIGAVVGARVGGAIGALSGCATGVTGELLLKSIESTRAD